MLDHKIYEVYEMVKYAEEYVLSGDMTKAREAYRKSADFLSALSAAHKGYEKITIITSAAVLYFEAGEYAKCKSLLDSVSGYKMSGETLILYNEAKERISGNYLANVVARIEKLKAKSAWQELLNVLADNPYVMPPTEMAKLRAIACRELSKHELAMEFEKDARDLL